MNVRMICTVPRLVLGLLVSVSPLVVSGCGSGSDTGSGAASGGGAGAGTGGGTNVGGGGAGGGVTSGGGATSDGGGAGGGVTQASAADWTMLGYDAASTYHNVAETRISPDSVGNLVVAHQIDMGVAVYGAPLIVGDTVCAAAVGVTCIDATTGQTVWENMDFPYSTGSLAYKDGLVYVLHSDAVLRAFDMQTGAVVWERPTSAQPGAQPFSSPMVGGDLVVVGGSCFEEMGTAMPTFRGYVYAVDATSGTEIWNSFTVGEGSTGASLWSSPSIDVAGGKVYAATGNNYTPPATDTSDSILQLDAADGTITWKAQRYEGDVWSLAESALGNPDYDFGTNPILFDAEVDGATVALVAAGQKSGDAHVLRRDTGAEVWTRNLCPGGAAGDHGIFNNGAWSGKHLLWACNAATSTAPGGDPPGATGTAVLFAIEPATGDIVWERQLGGVVVAPVTIAGGVGFVGADQQLQAFDVETGAVLYRLDVTGTIGSAPSVGNGRVAFGSGFTWLFGTPGSTLNILELP